MKKCQEVVSIKETHSQVRDLIQLWAFLTLSLGFRETSLHSCLLPQLL